MLMPHKDIARLCTHLVVPVAVGDILYNQTPVNDEIQYALHEALSEMDPDTGLLAIAISAQHIAVRHALKNPMAVALALEAEKIVDEYGPEWLLHAEGKPTVRDAKMIYDMLQLIPEDLECMADLIETVRAEISNENDQDIALCDILAIQARAHIEIAEYILEDSQKNPSEKYIPAGAVKDAAAASDNIILFPIHLRH